VIQTNHESPITGLQQLEPGLIAQVKKCGKGIQNSEKPSLSPLIFAGDFCMVRAMSRLIVFIIGIVWASLLLVSWGGTSEVPADTVALERSVR